MADLKLQLFEEPRDLTGVLKSWAFRLIVAGLFISVGKGKFAERGQWVAIFAQIGFGQWFRYFTGVLQIMGGLLVPSVYVWTVIASALCWCAGFALYAVRYWPVLTRPRVDGKPG